MTVTCRVRFAAFACVAIPKHELEFDSTEDVDDDSLTAWVLEHQEELMDAADEYALDDYWLEE